MNLVSMALLIQEEIRKYQKKHPEECRQHIIERHVLGVVMCWGRGHLNPKQILEIIQLEDSAYVSPVVVRC